MRCLKMPRSHCGTENVQFVQELAEVDGPFESPININFRDLTKLELPSLVWNQSDAPPKKMKITNTGHTVIISGKWKCERPYLTGGPLVGKYVFSQIHFHWGQDDCKGSEHQVCGEGFPLEMHVAHFKTDYLTQECALREKDGMVVVVYLFKLQEEPNAGLKKILNLLPCIKQASTSQAMDPRPILSLCNPFTDDYFMYWGSVVTSTCAHILLWIVCREPFGISREQVNEFRKILDSSQHPICRNNRDLQPLHKRNVFHVNASKNLDDPLLPIKKMMGCFCKGSQENICSKPVTHDRCCTPHMRNQEDIEGDIVEREAGTWCRGTKGCQGLDWKVQKNFYVHQSIFVQSATVHSAPVLPKMFGSENIEFCHPNAIKQTNSEGSSKMMPVSQSCCFFPMKEVNKIKSRTEKRKSRSRKNPLQSMIALSQIMDSLEALKNHTFKKLREIESINQEIRGIKSFCEDTEDRKWLRKIEKIMSKQKRFTIRTSQDCFNELKKLARECNFDRFFDSKALPDGDNNQNVTWLNNNEINDKALPYSEVCVDENEKKSVLENFNLNSIATRKISKFSTQAHKLVQSFFEDINESDDLQQSVEKNLRLKKIESLCGKQGGDSSSIPSIAKGLITQKMFVLGNLGDRFFKEVTTEDLEINPNACGDKKKSEQDFTDFVTEYSVRNTCENKDSKNLNEKNVNKENLGLTLKTETEETIPLHRANVAVKFSANEQSDCYESLPRGKNIIPSDNEHFSRFNLFSDTELSSQSGNTLKPYISSITKRIKTIDFKEAIKNSLKREIDDLSSRKVMESKNHEDMLAQFHYSSSNLSTDSSNTPRMIIAKFHKKQPRKNIWRKHSSLIAKMSSKGFYEKASYRKHKMKNLNFEGYYIKNKNFYNKKQFRKIKQGTSSYDAGSTSKEELKAWRNKSRWRRLAKAKFKLEIEKTSDSAIESPLEYSLVSPERKKLKLEYKKVKANILKGKAVLNECQVSLTDSESPPTDVLNKLKISQKPYETVAVQTQKESAEVKSASTDAKNIAVETIEKPQIVAKKVCLPKSPEIPSRVPISKTLRTSSMDSKSKCSDKQALSKPEDNGLESNRINPLKREMYQTAVQNPAIKNKSLTNLSTRTKFNSPGIQRVFVENFHEKRKNAAEPHELKKLAEAAKQREQNIRISTAKDLIRATSNETIKISDQEENLKNIDVKKGNEEKSEIQGQKYQKYNVGFFTTASQINEELIPRSALEGKSKSPVMTRCEIERYRFLDKEVEEIKMPAQEKVKVSQETLQATDSNKSLTNKGFNLKRDADLLTVENKELQTSVSYTTIKKNTQSRPHSAESLTSPTKATKRKRKKRPHCCKRSSRHYMRKNSSIFKKPSKVESKAVNFLGLSDEERLKIISINVAKYLKKKLVEHKKHFDSEKNCSFKELEQAVLQNLKAAEDEEEKVIIKEIASAKQLLEIKNSIKKSNDKVNNTKIPKEPSKAKELTSVKFPTEPAKDKKIPFSPRPVHNFIKLNKLMAGKYKRIAPVAERKAESYSRKKEEPKKESPKPKMKAARKKKEKFPLPKRVDQLTPKANCRQLQPVLERHEKTKNKKPPKETCAKTLASPKKPDSATKKTRKPSTIPIPEKPNPDPKPEASPRDTSACSMTLQKIPQPKKRWVPAYMLTSYMPAPIEIVENQQRKMNKYLLSMTQPNLTSYLPEVLYETKNRKRKKGCENESAFLNDLDYMFKLQMCLNNEISANTDNYMKTILGQDINVSTAVEKPPTDDVVDLCDVYNKKIVLIEMNNLLEKSSTSSDLVENSGKYLSQKNSFETSKHNLKAKEISSIKTPKESGDSEIINPANMREFSAKEDYNSDSSYNCEISITLNAGSNEGEGELQFYDPNCLGEFANNYSNYSCKYELARDSNVSQTTQLEGESSSQSVIMKPLRKKRKENEISMEMKQKLLEILEGEIKREMALSYGVMSENSSDGVALKWEDSDVINKSQSTESSCDNIEVLTQISETMRQYLTDFKERRLAEREADKESKDEDASPPS